MAGRRQDPETALIVRMVRDLDGASDQMRARVLGYLNNRYESSFTVSFTRSVEPPPLASGKETPGD